MHKTIDKIVTSRSIVAKKFPDFDVLDAMIASALKQLLSTQSIFRKRVSVEKQRILLEFPPILTKKNRWLTWFIYEYFRATGVPESMQGLAFLVL